MITYVDICKCLCVSVYVYVYVLCICVCLSQFLVGLIGVPPLGFNSYRLAQPMMSVAEVTCQAGAVSLVAARGR